MAFTICLDGSKNFPKCCRGQSLDLCSLDVFDHLPIDPIPVSDLLWILILEAHGQRGDQEHPVGRVVQPFGLAGLPTASRSVEVATFDRETVRAPSLLVFARRTTRR